MTVLPFLALSHEIGYYSLKTLPTEMVPVMANYSEWNAKVVMRSC